VTGLHDPAVQDEPFEYYRDRLQQCPVWHEDGLRQWVVGGHPEVRQVLMDVERFSSRPASSRHVSEASRRYHEYLAANGWSRQATLQRTDPPVHTRYRKLLNRVFSPAVVRDFVPQLEAICSRLVDDIATRGSCEFVDDFALPFPGTFIAEQLGLDHTQYRTFRRWADAMLATAQRPLTVDEALHEAAIEVEAQHFLAGEFERRRQQPSDDLISMLVHAHGDDEQPLTMAELQDLMHQLITGGFETTTSALAKGMLLLITHPEQMQLLRDEPRRMDDFIEETLRFDGPVQGLWRVTTCPVDIAGQTIPENTTVMVRYGAANRDGRVFADPDRFDITRENSRNHAAFGFGAHFCVGATLARQEMRTGFTMLLDRLASIELAEPMVPPVHEPSVFLRPVRRLPVVVTAR
jgi:cytochrome P450